MKVVEIGLLLVMVGSAYEASATFTVNIIPITQHEGRYKILLRTLSDVGAGWKKVWSCFSKRSTEISLMARLNFYFRKNALVRDWTKQIISNVIPNYDLKIYQQDVVLVSQKTGYTDIFTYMVKVPYGDISKKMAKEVHWFVLDQGKIISEDKFIYYDARIQNDWKSIEPLLDDLYTRDILPDETRQTTQSLKIWERIRRIFGR